MIHRWAKQLSAYLKSELDLDPARLNVLAYGLEAILGALVKLLAFTTLPLLLGIGPATWVAAGAAVFFRLPAGGAHCGAFDRCLISSLVIFMLAGTVGVLLTRQIYFLPFPFALTVLALAAVAVMLYVPADTTARPVINRREKRRLKAWAFSVLGVYLLLYLSFGKTVSHELVTAGGLGLLIQIFTVTPLGYRALDVLDRFLTVVLGNLTRREEVRT